MVLNDEAHHCYQRKQTGTVKVLSKVTKERRLRRTRKRAIVDVGAGGGSVANWESPRSSISATPFFLRGSGYAEGTFPWTTCDFSSDAIECGIVKLPRVPIADNIPGGICPSSAIFGSIRSRMPKKGRGKAKVLDPLSLPVELQTALEALYGHYEKTFYLWQSGRPVPPCFIIVCNNTATSSWCMTMYPASIGKTRMGLHL